MSQQKKVIVIGGGYGGSVAARSLDKNFEVTLVAGGDFFRHTVGGIRASVLPATTPRVHIPYDNLLKRGTVHRCRASKIDADACTVTLGTGETLPYDFLVLATGILHSKTVGVGGNHETAAKQAAVFEQANSEIKAASNILVVGGGPVGIETAGEISEEFPDKSVTLVTSKELMPSPTLALSERFRHRLLKKLQQIGVTVHTGCGRVDFSSEDIDACGFIVGKRMYSWEGAEAEADLCIVAAGARQTPSLYADSGLQGWLDDQGLLKVENTFEVKGAGGGGKVFALGDCADIPVPKMAYLAGEQGLVVAKQIAVSAAGKPLKGAVTTPLAVSLVPVGKSGGVSLLPMGIVVGDFLTRNLKSRDLFAGKFWGEMNAGKAPAIP